MHKHEMDTNSPIPRCKICGKFMKKECEEDSPLEDEVLQWWSCRKHGMFPEHLYFKSQFRRNPS